MAVPDAAAGLAAFLIKGLGEILHGGDGAEVASQTGNVRKTFAKEALNRVFLVLLEAFQLLDSFGAETLHDLGKHRGVVFPLPDVARDLVLFQLTNGLKLGDSAFLKSHRGRAVVQERADQIGHGANEKQEQNQLGSEAPAFGGESLEFLLLFHTCCSSCLFAGAGTAL